MLTRLAVGCLGLLFCQKPKAGVQWQTQHHRLFWSFPGAKCDWIMPFKSYMCLPAAVRHCLSLVFSLPFFARQCLTLWCCAPQIKRGVPLYQQYGPSNMQVNKLTVLMLTNAIMVTTNARHPPTRTTPSVRCVLRPTASQRADRARRLCAAALTFSLPSTDLSLPFIGLFTDFH